MIRRTLGSCGLEVSAVGIGCWAIGGPDVNLGLPMGWGPIDEGAALAGLERAYELGTSLFDTADVYGHGRSEQLLGQLVKQVPRDSVVLSSKVGYFAGTAPHGYHPRHMRHQLEQTLDNLRTDHVDIYFFHHAEFGSGDAYLDGVRDESFVAAHATGKPFYTGISYLLVSMECLIGAAYTKQVHAAGLTGTPRPSMGRLDAEFTDWRIGRFSHHAQLWVDRHFALDYTLKSLEKVLDGRPRHAARAARVVIKDAAFGLLQDMVAVLDRHPLQHRDIPGLDAMLAVLMDSHLVQLRARMAVTVDEVKAALLGEDTALLAGEYLRWTADGSWELINAADPCGT